MSRITPEIALIIVVRTREVLASLSILLLQWFVGLWTDSWGRENRSHQVMQDTSYAS